MRSILVGSPWPTPESADENVDLSAAVSADVSENELASPANLDDASLIARLGSKDASAFEVLFDRY